MNTFEENLKLLKTLRIKPNTKQPATLNGYKDAKLGQSVTLMKQEGYNVAIACRDSGLIVLDADVDPEKGLDGLETLARLTFSLGDLPYTLTQKTPRGGYHFIYSDEGIVNPIGKIGKDVDVKYNGYIMCYPSEINGKTYEFVDGFDDENFYINDLPQSWVDYLNGEVVNPSNFKHLNKKVYKNIDIETMFKRCPFLQFCKDNAAALSEPMWHSMITVLAQIEDSDDLIHELSMPYPKYKYRETQKKINYARKFGHSQSCRYISMNYPEVCQNCKYNSKKGE